MCGRFRVFRCKTRLRRENRNILFILLKRGRNHKTRTLTAGMTTDSSDRRTPETAKGAGPPAEGGEPFFLEVDGIDASSETVPVTEPATTDNRGGGDAPPAWFAHKQSKQPSKDKTSRRRRPTKKKTKKLKIVVEREKDEEENLTWQEQLKRWIVGREGKGFAVSLLFHVVLLLMFSVTVIQGLGDEEISTVVSMADEEVLEFEEIADATVEMEEEVVQPELKALQEASELAQPGVNLGGSISDALGGETSGGPGNFKFAMPKSGRAVTKGSFTAWTEPEDPIPNKDYLIIIQIKLPAKMKLNRYPLKDLSGKLVGTDGYEQQIPEDPARYLPIKEGRMQLVVTVPGAAKLVKDRIEIKSNLLKEQQTLEIEF